MQAARQRRVGDRALAVEACSRGVNQERWERSPKHSWVLMLGMTWERRWILRGCLQEGGARTECSPAARSRLELLEASTRVLTKGWPDKSQALRGGQEVRGLPLNVKEETTRSDLLRDCNCQALTHQRTSSALTGKFLARFGLFELEGESEKLSNQELTNPKRYVIFFAGGFFTRA